MFNTLKYARMLEEAGFSREEAETSIKILVEIMEDKLATKQDFIELKAAILGTQEELKLMARKEDLNQLRMDMKNDLLQMKHDLTIKMGTMLSTAVTLTVALITALHRFV